MKITMMLAAAGVALSMHATAFAAPSPNAYIDANGDEVRPFDKKGLAHDLAYIDARFDLRTSEFVIEVGFHNEIEPGWGDDFPISNETALHGLLGFDLDNDPTTGAPPIQNYWDEFEKLNLGLDLELGVFPTNPEGVIRALLFGEEVESRAEFFDTHFVAIFDLALFRGLSIVPGEYGIAGLFGTMEQPTDATDSIGKTYVVPTPATGALAALGGVAAMIRRRR